MFQSTVLLYKSRFKSDFLQEEIWNLLDDTFSIPKMNDYTFYEVNEEKYIGRPDVLALDIYGEASYADILCKLNGISNPFELNMGMILIIPGASEITRFAHAPLTSELESILDKDGNESSTKQKKRSEPRRTNEAIVGDRRFKIDKSSGIIIY